MTGEHVEAELSRLREQFAELNTQLCEIRVLLSLLIVGLDGGNSLPQESSAVK